MIQLDKSDIHLIITLIAQYIFTKMAIKANQKDKEQEKPFKECHTDNDKH